MKELVKKVKEQIEKEREDQISAFVRTKLNKKTELEKNIEALTKQLDEVNKSIERIEKEDYEEVDKALPANLYITNCPLTYTQSTWATTSAGGFGFK